MINLILFSLAVIGMSHIIVDSYLFMPFRRFIDKISVKMEKRIKIEFNLVHNQEEIEDDDTNLPLWLTGNFLKNVKLKWDYLSHLFTCYQCTGTWCGIFCGYFLINNTNIFNILICGFAGSFLSQVGAVILNYYEVK